jgi:hypothetical protein
MSELNLPYLRQKKEFMLPHHTQSIENVIRHFEKGEEIQALLLGGSLAHGFGTATSDVDILLVVSDEAYQQRASTGHALFFSRELCTYPEGYIDGKYLSLGFLDVVKEKGSEPARFAFKDAKILISRIDGLEQRLQAVTQYPVADKANRIQRFHGQFEAWHWYTGEAIRHSNQYLLNTTVSKLILFGGRMILAHNEMLYPFHKWFIRVLEQAKDKPSTMMQQIDVLLTHPTREAIEQFYETVKNFQPWGAVDWPTQFQIDSELNWLDGHTPVDDL